jgi:D-sedoheptulose 7-phosphate isomerase
MMGIRTVALTGGGGGRLAQCTDVLINAPSLSTPRIQELHIAIGHTICELLEDALAS